MGAWGTGPFENDDALDFVAEVEEGGGKAIAAAVKAVPAKGFVEAPAGSNALAAGEIIAAARGRSMTDLPEEVTAWIKESAWKPKPDLIASAASAVKRVLESTDSELRELWEEAADDDAAAWRKSVQDLLNRLI